ncbi:alpha/beta hydrolase family protein [Streptomyces sp. CA-294286]|uniref:alpha/beta hydrolase family protein n=1 Tax=Streptomyces sp. CA-294286 TaxID=3240070 RepID=UPI003D8AEF49
MRRRTFLTGAAVTAASVSGLTAGTATAQQLGSPPLALPRPTGGHPIGLTVLHLRDTSRTDPWVPTGKRELMVSLWYPARRPSGPTAPYMTAAESTLYLASSGYDLPLDVLSGVRTHAIEGARPVRPRAGLPLVVLSPGFGMPRATLSGLAEELASRGFAVAAVGHNYEAHGTTFPDGRTTDREADRDFPKVGAVRAADVTFVLDELTATRCELRTGVRVDGSRIAMAGHSAGGFSTVPAMVRDPRVRAGLNMDGDFHYPNDVPLDRPYLMLGRPNRTPGAPNPSWDETWPELTGWKRWLSVDGVQHLSFTDVAPLAKQLGLGLQDLDGDRADALTRAYVAAFADAHLRGRHTALLDGPSARFPEVRFHSP